MDSAGVDQAAAALLLDQAKGHDAKRREGGPYEWEWEETGEEGVTKLRRGQTVTHNSTSTHGQHLSYTPSPRRRLRTVVSFTLTHASTRHHNTITAIAQPPRSSLSLPHSSPVAPPSPCSHLPVLAPLPHILLSLSPHPLPTSLSSFNDVAHVGLKRLSGGGVAGAAVRGVAVGGAGSGCSASRYSTAHHQGRLFISSSSVPAGSMTTVLTSCPSAVEQRVEWWWRGERAEVVDERRFDQT